MIGSKTMNARTEANPIVYEVEEKKEIPRVAIIRDYSSGHFILYRLEEMSGDEIRDHFDGSTSRDLRIPVLKKISDLKDPKEEKQ